MANSQWTTMKCTACSKTVYPVDKLTADKRVYHRPCFRCHHCNATLKLGNYNSIDGVLYCKPHFDQLLKTTGRIDKSFEGTPKIVKQEKQIDPEILRTKSITNAFAGTREKCASCNKTVYLTERVTVNGVAYHKICFRCSHGGCVISPSNYIAYEGKLYCKHHHMQLVKEKGDFSKLQGEQDKISLASSSTSATDIADASD